MILWLILIQVSAQVLLWNVCSLECALNIISLSIFYNKGDCDFEYSDIGFCQEESLLTPDITSNQLSVVTSDMVTTSQDSEKLQMNAYQSRLKLSHQGNEQQIMKGDCKII